MPSHKVRISVKDRGNACFELLRSWRSAVVSDTVCQGGRHVARLSLIFDPDIFILTKICLIFLKIWFFNIKIKGYGKRIGTTQFFCHNFNFEHATYAFFVKAAARLTSATRWKGWTKISSLSLPGTLVAMAEVDLQTGTGHSTSWNEMPLMPLS